MYEHITLIDGPEFCELVSDVRVGPDRDRIVETYCMVDRP